MMVLLAPSIVVGLAGFVLYAMAGNAKAQEVGRIMFFCGLLVALLRGIPLIK